jgi:TatD DNase family protein
LTKLCLTDTHCHLNLSHFDDDREEVIQRAIEVGVEKMVIPAIDVESSKSIAGFVQNRNELLCAVGVHPNDSNRWDELSYQQLDQLIEQDQLDRHKIVAIGEIGLDRYWNDTPHNIQESALLKQLELATKWQLPLILHMREDGDATCGSCADTLVSMVADWVEVQRKTGSPLVNRPGVFHSFSGDKKTLQKILDLNFFVGVSGPVTYKNSDFKREVVKSIPLDKLLIETDSPFLSPVPNRGKRNEPTNVKFIVEKISEIFDKNPEMIASVTYQNAQRLFSWEVDF